MSPSAHGRPPQSGTGRPLRGIPRSRAYWELKAEQMMNRIFDPDDPIDLPFEAAAPEASVPAASGSVAPAAPATAAVPDRLQPRQIPPQPPEGDADPAGAAAAASGRPSSATRRVRPARPSRPPAARAADASNPGRRFDDRLLLIAALAGVCMVSVAGSLLYFGYWNRLQQSLTQERNLLLVERLRSLGPATPAPVPAPQPVAPTLPAPAPFGSQAGSSADGLPPPPPEEPWMQQLSSLPQPGASPPRVLTVPVSPRLGAAAAAASTSPAAVAPTAGRPGSAASLPQLVGVVGGPGRSSSAIFLVGGSSMSVGSGEMIGSSGWRLRSADGETALIERDGDVRQVSIASGNGF